MAEKTRPEELFDEFKKKALDDEKSSTQAFDDNLLKFSSGALGLSLAFIKDIVPLPKAIWLPSLYVSWVAFALCIMVTMASFQFSNRANRESISFGEAYFLRGDTEAFNKHQRIFSYRAIDGCTVAASLLFVIGIVCTILFATMNVWRVR